ncbi:MAG: NAD(P)H-binding protein [Furfurilactobacillus sp.]|jgi:putative NADH-flavin reductase|uniref:NAD(P)H-binding protein n=1 Tax=Furfurilactobacillus milii TaxID=2888272 RepID=A0ABT6D898_9LACO|nr:MULTISPECIES: NAD(P)H-binding protein [Furfurilactobacillus]QLE65698.1 Rrf2-linked NADH-flavin reductase [Furfurilactobacillus rossiae]MCF6160391.1 NAD(P)H-binding protein [Furfurilactobacillus milii]MCF6162334.1 NAD(P)H-binding protein [Furfurilactobacillus milii]MCF6420053.1 NAD(P)H-binding protein [Furfurilactobacillus milii]MCH4012223.1 NAD(P)H-binding protein [Furfurilactobacillus sp.]
MKIGIIGATNRTGNVILREAQSRDIDVEVILRDRRRVSSDAEVLEIEPTLLTSDDIEDLDVLVCAFGTGKLNDSSRLYPALIKHLIEITKQSSVRLMVVGSSSCLYTDAERSQRLFDEPGFPEAAKNSANSLNDVLKLLRASDGVDWTYISPAEKFVFRAPRTGHYQLGTDFRSYNAAGLCEVSYADYAIAFVDEIQNHQHINEHISVVSR